MTEAIKVVRAKHIGLLKLSMRRTLSIETDLSPSETLMFLSGGNQLPYNKMKGELVDICYE
jgi:hypothetical protein